MPEVTTSRAALIQARRAQLLAFEAALAQHPDAVHGDSEQLPLTHHFSEGLYVREIRIPRHSLVIGKIHKHSHPVFLLEGAILVYTESGGSQELHAPAVFISAPGAKRAALALEDTRWITCHANPSDTQDLRELEAAIIAPSFEAYDAYRAALEAGANTGGTPCRLSPLP